MAQQILEINMEMREEEDTYINLAAESFERERENKANAVEMMI